MQKSAWDPFSVPLGSVPPKSLLIMFMVKAWSARDGGPLLYRPLKPGRAAGTSPFLRPLDFLLLGGHGRGRLTGSPVHARVGGCSPNGGAEPFRADTGCHVSGYRTPDSAPLLATSLRKLSQGHAGCFSGGFPPSCRRAGPHHFCKFCNSVPSPHSPQESLLSSPARPRQRYHHQLVASPPGLCLAQALPLRETEEQTLVKAPRLF